jgi:hypothetical protein
MARFFFVIFVSFVVKIGLRPAALRLCVKSHVHGYGQGWVAIHVFLRSTVSRCAQAGSAFG